MNAVERVLEYTGLGRIMPAGCKPNVKLVLEYTGLGGIIEEYIDAVNGF